MGGFFYPSILDEASAQLEYLNITVSYTHGLFEASQNVSPRTSKS